MQLNYACLTMRAQSLTMFEMGGWATKKLYHVSN